MESEMYLCAKASDHCFKMRLTGPKRRYKTTVATCQMFNMSKGVVSKHKDSLACNNLLTARVECAISYVLS